MPRVRIRSIAIAIVILNTIGCAPWSSYPPVETGSALLNPRFEPVPTLLSKSIRYVHQNYGTEDAYTFALPVGMPDSLPVTLANRLGDDAAFTQNPAAADYRVLQVRARGSDGEVDMTYRRADGQEQMVTISLEKPLPLEPYRVVHAKNWRIRADLLDDIYAMPEEAIDPVEPVGPAGADPTGQPADADATLPPTVSPASGDLDDDDATPDPGANESS